MAKTMKNAQKVYCDIKEYEFTWGTQNNIKENI